MMHLAHPYGFDVRGRTAEARDYAQHVAGLVEQALLVTPGERVNRPDYGTGLPDMVFEPGAEVLADATAFLVRAALQRWLQDVLVIEGLAARLADNVLIVDLVYTTIETGMRQTQTVERAL
jgi:uncharacterized protein